MPRNLKARKKQKPTKEEELFEKRVKAMRALKSVIDERFQQYEEELIDDVEAVIITQSEATATAYTLFLLDEELKHLKRMQREDEAMKPLRSVY